MNFGALALHNEQKREKEERERQARERQVAAGEALYRDDTAEQNQTENTLQELAAKKKKKEEEAERRALLQKREEAVKQRQDLRNSAVGGLPARIGDGGGTLAKAAHLASLNAEGVAAEMIVDAFIFAVQFLFNTSYMAQKSHYYQAMQTEANMAQRVYAPKGGILPPVYELKDDGSPDQTKLINVAVRQPTKAELTGNNLIHPDDFTPLIYRKDANGRYPLVYKVEENGEINYTRRYAEGEAPLYAIRRNGLIPVPDYAQGWKDAVSFQIERMMGADWLTPVKKLELYGYLEQHSNAPGKKKDLRSDVIAMQGATRPAAPAPRPK